MTEIEKPNFIMPDAKKREKRLAEYLPEFLEQYDGELPDGFQEVAKQLVKITTDKEAFAACVEAGKKLEELRDACEFIGKKTAKDHNARHLQDELINGLMRRWAKNAEKIAEANTDKEKIKKAVRESPVGKFILDIMLELLKPNMNAIIFPQVSSEPQLYQTAHIRDFEGDAMDILQKKMFTYDESKSHFKTHLQWGFRGFWKKLQQHKFERGSRAFSEMDGDDIDGASFADRQVDTREASVQERAATNSVIEQMRAAIAALDERD